MRSWEIILMILQVKTVLWFAPVSAKFVVSERKSTEEFSRGNFSATFQRYSKMRSCTEEFLFFTSHAFRRQTSLFRYTEGTHVMARNFPVHFGPQGTDPFRNWDRHYFSKTNPTIWNRQALPALSAPRLIIISTPLFDRVIHRRVARETFIARHWRRGASLPWIDFPLVCAVSGSGNGHLPSSDTPASFPVVQFVLAGVLVQFGDLSMDL